MGIVIAANIPLSLAKELEEHINKGKDENKNQAINRALSMYLRTQR